MACWFSAPCPAPQSAQLSWCNSRGGCHLSAFQMFILKQLSSFLFWRNYERDLFLYCKVNHLHNVFLIPAHQTLVGILKQHFSTGCGYMFVFVVLHVKVITSSSDTPPHLSTARTLRSCRLLISLLITSSILNSLLIHAFRVDTSQTITAV